MKLIMQSLLILNLCIPSAYAGLIKIPAVATFDRIDELSTNTTFQYEDFVIDDAVLESSSSHWALQIASVYFRNGIFHGYAPGYAGRNSYQIATGKSGLTLRKFLASVALPPPLYMRWMSPEYTDVCQGVVLTNTDTQTSENEKAEVAYTMVTAPIPYVINKFCAQLPPASVSCEIENESLLFDFGELTLSTARNKEISRNISLTCNHAARVMFTTPSGGHVALSNGGAVDLTIEGEALIPSGHVLSFSKGETKTVSLKGTLVETGSTGAFQGETIIMLWYP